MEVILESFPILKEGASIDCTKNPKWGGVTNLNHSMNDLRREGFFLDVYNIVILHDDNTSRVTRGRKLDEVGEAQIVSHALVVAHTSFKEGNKGALVDTYNLFVVSLEFFVVSPSNIPYYVVHHYRWLGGACFR